MRPAAEHPSPDLWSRFTRFQVAIASSDLADGAYRVLVPLIALQTTRSALVVALVGLGVRLPWLIATLPAGVAVDRGNPLLIMRTASLLRLSLMTLTCVLAWSGHLPLWLLAVSAFLIGCAGSFVDVAAQAALPTLVSRDMLPRANSSVQTIQTVSAQMVAPALGGAAVALGNGQALGSVAILYVVTVLALGRLLPAPSATEPPPPEAASRGWRNVSLRSQLDDLGEGWRYFRTRPDLIRVAAAAAANNFSYAMCFTLLPLIAVSPGRLGLSSTGYGLLLAAIAVGSMLAAPVAPWLGARIGRDTLMRRGGPVLGLTFATLVVPHVWAVAAGLMAYGFAIIVWNVSVVSYRQTTVPAEVFGRVSATYRWLTWGVFPIGSLLGGVLATLANLNWVFLTAAVLPLITAVLFPVRPGRAAEAPAT